MAKPLQGREITAVNVSELGWGTVRWVGAETHAHSMCYDDARYKFTFYLLTYLLTYITTLDMFCPAFVSE